MIAGGSRAPQRRGAQPAAGAHPRPGRVRRDAHAAPPDPHGRTAATAAGKAQPAAPGQGSTGRGSTGRGGTGRGGTGRGGTGRGGTGRGGNGGGGGGGRGPAGAGGGGGGRAPAR